MASSAIKATIMKHLSSKEDSWGSTVACVCKEMGVGERFVEEAMKELVERGELKRMSASGNPMYAAPGHIDGKYKPFTEKRMDAMTPSVRVDNVYDESPWHADIKGPKAV
jgi:hypothetical protein